MSIGVLGFYYKMNCVWLMCNAGSKCNSSMLTFDGVDVMGERLAKEVGCGLAI